ncbi:membrane protein DedA with SNARE-associated domain [Isoptericola jiangsuensis]|uniref:Membrane protein DedA with SNARE-associated domain n=1 Tax=Isoptericola jiangsuensis TaxID=548579 RepID=A0A2A9EXK2_9MICO|nr:VTT domain-containing protein [Isoptericola jiangsuensis]PFG43618.1 membrane protein DedA with SNARE-associated domain [Isoptericola jiangsuensis]
MTNALTLAAATDDAARHGVFTLNGFPFWAVYAAAFCLVMARAQATYWLGRGVARGLGGSRVASVLEGPRAVVVVGRIHRWGPPAVTLSFLTVGVQTVVNLCAGYLRMPFGRYLVALFFGCLIWAAVWTTVGTAAVYAAIWLFLLHPAALAAALVLVAGGAWWWLRRRRDRLATTTVEPL